MRSSIDTLSIALVTAPFAAIAGTSVAKLQYYRPQAWIAWCIFLIGMGVYTLVDADSSKGLCIGINAIMSIGAGILYCKSISTSCAFTLGTEPHGASVSDCVLPSIVTIACVRKRPRARFSSVLPFICWCMFPFSNVRFQANAHHGQRRQVWAVAIGAAILQNQLARRLPPEVLQQILGTTQADSSNVNLAYSIISIIRTMQDPLKHEVRQAFGDSLVVVWQTMLGILGIGFIASLFMQNIPLHTQTDKKWDLHEPGNPHTEVTLEKITDHNASASFVKMQDSIKEVPASI